MNSQSLAPSRITDQEREALRALIDGGVLKTAQAKKAQERVRARQAVRARLEVLPELRVDLDRRKAERATLADQLIEAQAKAQALAREFITAEEEEAAARRRIDRLEGGVGEELWRLADPKCAELNSWLLEMHDRARRARRVVPVFSRKLWTRTGRAVEEAVSNGDAVASVLGVIRQALEDVDELVLVSNDLDMRPALARIRDRVLEAFAALDVGVDLPQIELA